MNGSRSNFPISSETFQPMLRESIDRFLLEHKGGSKDFSNFSSIFSRILQISTDPPLEIVWLYSALTYHTAKLCLQDPSEHVSQVKDLFQLLVSCSSSCSAAKKIAVLAPVLHELYCLVIERKSSKKEVECFLEIIVSYISIYSSMDELENEGEHVGIILFEDLIRVWTIDKPSKDVRVFFPIISEELGEGMKSGCGVGHLAGIVMCEVFLLRLCLRFDTRIFRAEFDQDMRSWVIRTIGGFQNLHFFDILLRMLLEPVLPVSSVLKFEDEVLLREVLYDSVIMVDYPFINPQNSRKPCKKHLKSIAVMLLLVAESAIRFVRENGDNSKVDTYSNALSKSCLPSQLLKWVTSQTGAREITTTRPTVSTPSALIKWLLIVEDLGMEVFDSHKLKLHAKAVVCKSRVEYELPLFKLECGSNNNGIFLSAYNNGKGEEEKFNNDLEMVDSANATMLTWPVHGMVSDASRKRKDGSKEESEIPVKHVKFHVQENVSRCRFHQPAIEECGNGVDKLGFNGGDALEMEY